MKAKFMMNTEQKIAIILAEIRERMSVVNALITLQDACFTRNEAVHQLVNNEKLALNFARIAKLYEECASLQTQDNIEFANEIKNKDFD
jgi:hypothetical protein